ncbi:MAG: hypothetical protein NTW96_00865 [Planctomycetia bacterium]|nr:hypothetical protein [Planctomycetia bacterium]
MIDGYVPLLPPKNEQQAHVGELRAASTAIEGDLSSGSLQTGDATNLQ